LTRLTPSATLPARCPPALAAALEARSATIATATPDPPRTYVLADSPQGRLFAWFTSSARDEPVLEHELAVREAIGSNGALRAPAILAHGRGWRLEPALESDPLEGPDAVSRAVTAAEELASRTLPQLDLRRFGRAAGARFATLRRRALMARSPLPLRDTVAARRIVESSELPPATSHGDFHSGHIFVSGDEGAWVIDWEMVAPRPAGWDLLYLWADLDRPEDRDLVFTAALGVVGEARRAQLERLHYAAVVRMIAAKVAEPNPLYRDPNGAQRLLAELPRLREAAAGRDR